MTWYDVEDVLYDGDKKEIESLICPDCGGSIEYEYIENINVFKVQCKDCGCLIKANGSPKPNCVEYFGNKHLMAM